MGSDTHVSIYTMQPAKSEFASRGQETANADNNATDVSAFKIDAVYDNYKWEHDLDDKALTLREVAGLGPNEVILWNGHGNYFAEVGSTLILSETIYDTFYTGDNIIYICNQGNYLVTSYFVDTYIQNMSNSFIYMSTCAGLRDGGLANSFRNKGAAAVVGNTDIINTIYTSNMMSAVVDGLLFGNNLDGAMAYAKSIYGQQDSNLYSAEGAVGHAVPLVFCGGDYTFAGLDTLPNGVYRTNDMPTVNNPESRNMGTMTKASINNGILTITASFEQGSSNNMYPYSTRRLRVADNVPIVGYGGMNPDGSDDLEYYSIERFNQMYSDINAPDRMNHAGLGISLTVENGVVTHIGIHS